MGVGSGWPARRSRANLSFRAEETPRSLMHSPSRPGPCAGLLKLTLLQRKLNQEKLDVKCKVSALTGDKIRSCQPCSDNREVNRVSWMQNQGQGAKQPLQSRGGLTAASRHKSLPGSRGHGSKPGGGEYTKNDSIACFIRIHLWHVNYTSTKMLKEKCAHVKYGSYYWEIELP